MLKRIVLPLFAGLVCTASAATLFSDDFVNGSNWGKVTQGTVTVSPEAGGTRFVNADTAMSVLFVHTLDAAPASFTYSFELTSAAASRQAGVMFCWQKTSLSGYSYTAGAGEGYTLYRWDAGQPTVLAGGKNSWISGAHDKLEVRRSGGSIVLACNGVRIASVEDATYAGGDIGIYIGNGGNFLAQKVELSDVADSLTPRRFVADSFDDDALNGWRSYYPDATLSEADGALHLNGNGNSGFVITNGDFTGVPCTTIVTNESIDSGAMYGLVAMKISTDLSSGISMTFENRSFLINGERKAAVFAGSSYSPSLNTNIHGTTDTLVIDENGAFSVNGHLVDNSTFTAPFDSCNALGIFFDANALVSVSSFRAGSAPVTAIINRPSTSVSRRPAYAIGGMGIIVDPMGRTMAKLGSGDYRDKVKNLAGGVYCIIDNGGKSGEIRRAVVNVR